MGAFHLTPCQRQDLFVNLKAVHDARVFRRTLALLEADAGVPVSELARKLGVHRDSIYRWMTWYREGGDALALWDQPGPGGLSMWTEEREALLREILALNPQDLGFQTANWTAF